MSSKITHQITQVSVFYQMNSTKEDFRVPTKKVSLIARLAKQIVIQDKINIPRQSRAQFTLTVLEMLKASQKYVLMRNEQKNLTKHRQQASEQSAKSFDSKASDFTSISSNLVSQQAELVGDLTKQVEALNNQTNTKSTQGQ